MNRNPSSISLQIRAFPLPKILATLRVSRIKICQEHFNNFLFWRYQYLKAKLVDAKNGRGAVSLHTEHLLYCKNRSIKGKFRFNHSMHVFSRLFNSFYACLIFNSSRSSVSSYKYVLRTPVLALIPGSLPETPIETYGISYDIMHVIVWVR